MIGTFKQIHLDVCKGFYYMGTPAEIENVTVHSDFYLNIRLVSQNRIVMSWKKDHFSSTILAKSSRIWSRYCIDIRR